MLVLLADFGGVNGDVGVPGQGYPSVDGGARRGGDDDSGEGGWVVGSFGARPTCCFLRFFVFFVYFIDGASFALAPFALLLPLARLLASVCFSLVGRFCCWLLFFLLFFIVG